MNIVINISEEDYKAIQNTVFSVEEMYETVNGRTYCAICRGIVIPTDNERK